MRDQQQEEDEGEGEWFRFVSFRVLWSLRFEIG